MATGDFQCQYCGSYWCGFPVDGVRTSMCYTRREVEDSMSMRERKRLPFEPICKMPDVERVPNPFDLATDSDYVEQVQSAERLSPKGGLLAYLTEYLGDEVFARRFADCIDLIKAKNADYTQGTAKKDRIAAFRRIGGDIDVPMRKVWAIFAQKHWGAVMKYVVDGQVESEPIDGRINDLINYMVLLGAIIGDGKE